MVRRRSGEAIGQVRETRRALLAGRRVWASELVCVSSASACGPKVRTACARRGSRARRERAREPQDQNGQSSLPSSLKIAFQSFTSRSSASFAVPLSAMT